MTAINRYLEAVQAKVERYEELDAQRINAFRNKDFDKAGIIEAYDLMPLQEQIRLLMQRINYLIEKYFHEGKTEYA